MKNSGTLYTGKQPHRVLAYVRRRFESPLPPAARKRRNSARRKTASAPLHTAAVRVFPADERETSACFGHGIRPRSARRIPSFSAAVSLPRESALDRLGKPRIWRPHKGRVLPRLPLRPFGLCRAAGAETLNCLKTKHIVAGRRPPLRGPARFDRKGTKQQWHLCTHSAAA